MESSIGRIAASVALAGFVASVAAYVLDEMVPIMAFENNGINP